MRNSPGDANYWPIDTFVPYSVLPILKMDGVILSGKYPENKTNTCFISIFYVGFIPAADLKH